MGLLTDKLFVVCCIGIIALNLTGNMALKYLNDSEFGRNFYNEHNLTVSKPISKGKTSAISNRKILRRPKVSPIILKNNLTRNYSPLLKMHFCGNDEFNKKEGNRTKRYLLQGGKWKKLRLTWAIIQDSSRQQVRDIARDQFRKATEVWSDVSKLHFVEVHPENSNIDIKVKFVEGDHGDGFAFDGEGKTLAHAFYPNSHYSGHVHFDDTESYISHFDLRTKVKSGVSLLTIAAHELGHALGLLHSNEDNALMAPFYVEFQNKVTLFPDDETAIQSLYGRENERRIDRPSTTKRPFRATSKIHNTTWRPSSNTHPPTSKTTKGFTARTPSTQRTTTLQTIFDHTTSKANNWCKENSAVVKESSIFSGSVDAVVAVYSDLFIYFINDYMIRVDKRYQAVTIWKIAHYFRELHGRNIDRIDAAYAIADELVLFSNKNVIRLYTFSGNKHAQFLTLDSIGVTADKVDAAWVWGLNGRIYVLSGDLYWRLDANGHAESDYPRNAGVWGNLPRNVSAAFTTKETNCTCQ